MRCGKQRRERAGQMRSEKSMPLRSSRAGAGAIEERAEEGDHAQQSFGTEVELLNVKEKQTLINGKLCVQQ